MRTPVFEDPPLLCGHRGSGRGIVGGLAENTIESHLAALAAGVPWVETDARVNGDGELVVQHDPLAPDGRLVSQLATAETDSLGLVRVRDLLDALPGEAGVNLEIKTSLEDALRPAAETTAAAVARLVADSDRPLLVTSFDPSAVVIFHEHAPRIAFGLLSWSRFPLRKAIPAAAQLGADVIAPHANSLVHDGERPLAEMIDTAHAAGLQMLAWNVPHERIGELGELGVDCMIVDDVPASLTRRGGQ